MTNNLSLPSNKFAPTSFLDTLLRPLRPPVAESQPPTTQPPPAAQLPPSPHPRPIFAPVPFEQFIFQGRPHAQATQALSDEESYATESRCSQASSNCEESDGDSGVDSDDEEWDDSESELEAGPEPELEPEPESEPEVAQPTNSHSASRIRKLATGGAGCASASQASKKPKVDLSSLTLCVRCSSTCEPISSSDIKKSSKSADLKDKAYSK